MSESLVIHDGHRSQFQSKLVSAEFQGLKLLVVALDAYDERSEDDFADVIDAVLVNRFTPAEIAAEFKVSVATVSRWRASKCAPVAHARGVIVNGLREMLVQTIAQLQGTNSRKARFMIVDQEVA